MNTLVEMRIVGKICQGQKCRIEIAPEYRAALTGLDEFSHVQVYWVFDRATWDGKTLIMPPCYRKLDHELGLFATRGPFRPSPLAVTVCRILSMELATGLLELDWIDAENDTPVIDLKPYHPSSDIVAEYSMPDWCAHWPKRREASGDFDWGAEFSF